MPLAPPPLEKGRSPSPALSRARRVGISARAGGDQCTVRGDPHPARKSAPTPLFKGRWSKRHTSCHILLRRSHERRSYVIACALSAAMAPGVLRRSWRSAPLTDSPPLLYSRLGAFARPCPCGGIGRRA